MRFDDGIRVTASNAVAQKAVADLGEGECESLCHRVEHAPIALGQSVSFRRVRMRYILIIALCSKHSPSRPGAFPKAPAQRYATLAPFSEAGSFLRISSVRG
jgi:hypothetical protein